VWHRPLNRENRENRDPAPPLHSMRIAKPMLLVLTPIGVSWGLLEAWRFHWWLAVLMGVLVGVISLFMWMTVKRIRDERRQT